MHRNNLALKALGSLAIAYFLLIISDGGLPSQISPSAALALIMLWVLLPLATVILFYRERKNLDTFDRAIGWINVLLFAYAVMGVIVGFMYSYSMRNFY